MNPAPRWPVVVVGICAAGVLTALAWATVNVLSLESRERQSQSDAEFEQSVRLALWRIDSALTPLIAREASRPYFQYQSFYSADRAYGAMLDEGRAGESFVPSPLLQEPTPFVLLHFQRTDQGSLSSPEAPTDAQRALAESANVPREKILAADVQLGQLAAILLSGAIGAEDQNKTEHRRDTTSLQEFDSKAAGSGPRQIGQPKGPPTDAPRALAQSQEIQARNDFGARQQAFQRAIPSANQALQSLDQAPERVVELLSPTTSPKAVAEPSHPALGASAPADALAKVKSNETAAESKNERDAQDNATKNRPVSASRSDAGAITLSSPLPPGSAITEGTEAAKERADAESMLDKKNLADTLERERPLSSSSLDASFRDAASAVGKRSGDAKSYEIEAAARASVGASVVAPEVRSAISIGELVPRWFVGDGDRVPQLVLIRAVRAGDSHVVQGCWIDWPALHESLVADVRDLLPAAHIEPIINETAERDRGLARRLAAIPARIEPGPTPTPASPPWTPMRSALTLTWIAVLAALIGLASLVRTARDLAERRGRFVSAVTHELRTPLTTFVLYSQMLADGVVRDEAARSEYLATLKGESTRLARIVENVLDYARLGRRPHPARVGARTVSELLAIVLPDLARRVEHAGATLLVRDGSLNEHRLRIDPTSLGRGLFNLVDNACKYATAIDHDAQLGAMPRTVGISVEAYRNVMFLRVTDQGCGISVEDQRRLFKPFQHGSSLDHASKSGLGLGLSLSREIARHAGGDVKLEHTSASGTTFVMSLPIVRD